MAKGNFGVQFWLWNGTALTKLAGVTSVKPAETERGTYRTTTHDTTGGAHTYQGEALVEPGALTVVMDYESGSPTDLLLLAALADPDPRAYRIIFPGGVRKVDGFTILTRYGSPEMGLEGKQESTLTFQASGAGTQAANP
ncbi:MAG: hypothetical protein C0494_17645 [Sphingobium sp.]|nr:hypothetical protein [Sphingobium sp.]